MNILILHSQVPFVRGGAEVLVDGLAGALVDKGHEVDIVALPLQWNPPERLLTTAMSWRLLDLSRSNAKHVDRVICTKFPTWAVEHQRKSLWLIHQHRQAYDLHGTSLSEFKPDAESQAVRERVWEIDRRGIGSCDRRFAISRNVAERLRRYNGLDAAPLYPPVPRGGLAPCEYQPFVLSVARLDASKRVGALIQAIPRTESSLRFVIAGDGPDRPALEQKARSLGIADRVEFLGRVDDERLRVLYNTCRCVYYAPVDEDYGYATVEALAAGKPVITASDSGGVLEFVADGVLGCVASIDAESLARTIDRFEHETYARALGSSGPQVTSALTWNAVVDALVGNS